MQFVIDKGARQKVVFMYISNEVHSLMPWRRGAMDIAFASGKEDTCSNPARA
jgi:hypothetical protein